MKKLSKKVLVSVTLIAGYGIVSIAFFLGILLLGYILLELVFVTIESPSLVVLSTDAAFLVVIFFVMSRKAVRNSFSNFWKQILKNM